MSKRKRNWLSRLPFGLFLAVAIAWPLAAGETAAPSATPSAEAAARRDYNGVFSASLSLGPEEALAAFTELQARLEAEAPDSDAVGDCLFQRAFQLAELERYEEAVALNQELADRFPGNRFADDALFRNGEICEKNLRDFTRALAFYDRLCRVYRGSDLEAAGNYRGGVLSAWNGDNTRANVQFTQAQEADRRFRGQRQQAPPREPGEFELAALEAQNFINETIATAHGEEALRLYFEGLEDLAGQPARAEEKFRRIVAFGADCSLADEATYYAADCQRRQGLLTESYQALLAFTENHPDSSVISLAWQRIGAMRRLMDDEAGAIEALNEARRLVNEDSFQGRQVQRRVENSLLELDRQR